MIEKTLKSLENNGVIYQVIQVLERFNYPSIYHEFSNLCGKPIYHYEVRELDSLSNREYSSTVLPYKKALEWFKDKVQNLQ